MEPLSVISPASSDGGSTSTTARAMRFELPVLGRVLSFDWKSLALKASAGKTKGPRPPAFPPADPRVAPQRREVGEERGAQRADVHPGAGRELEILGDAAAEQQPRRGVGLVGEHERVAEPVIAFLVECLPRQLRLAPAPRRGVSTSTP